MRLNKKVALLCVTLSLAVFTDCSLKSKKPDERARGLKQDLKEIRERGKLVVLTGFNPLSYFIYKGRPMGYNYELFKLYSEDAGLELEMRIVHDADSVYHLLNTGQGDVIAFGQAATRDGLKKVAFTQPFMQVRQMLVQRKPSGWEKMPYEEVENHLIREPLELAGLQVHVKTGTAHFERILDIAEEIGYEIDVVPMSGDISPEDLIRMVSGGEIQFTIADENVAMLNSTYYPNLDVQTALSEPTAVAWAVRKNSPELLKSLDEWLSKNRKSETFNFIYRKYFKSKKNITAWGKSDYSSVSGGKISEYDNLIRRYARDLGWDWRLLAALIYEESQFDPAACSWAGAEGLMQLMAPTGIRFGVTNLNNPEQNLFAGTAYLKYLQTFWSDIPDSLERVKFILASYNTGESHVRDAVRLAQKHGADPQRWDHHVAEYLIKKSKPDFYNDPVVQSGYCRGESVVQYVKNVLYHHNHYVKMIGNS